MKLVTSNKFKLKEFKRFGLNLDIASGLDLDEVDGTPEEVIIYKAIEAGNGLMVEDTILIVDNVEIVDIRDRIQELDTLIGKKATWKVSIACVIDDEIHIASSEVDGTIGKPNHDLSKSFGFDPFFYITNDTLPRSVSLSTLEELEMKDQYSARKQCVDNFINKKNDFKIINLNDVPKWEGKYQDIIH
jgi:inosine/xanthosine triphosphate pyrophosphatase family protein